MDQTFPLLVPDREMCLTTHAILEEAIGSHLHAPLPPRPGLCGADETAPDSPEPHVLVHVPSLDVSHRFRVAAVRKRPDGRFEETEKAMGVARRHEDRPRIASQEPGHLLR